MVFIPIGGKLVEKKERPLGQLELFVEEHRLAAQWRPLDELYRMRQKIVATHCRAAAKAAMLMIRNRSPAANS